MGLIHILSLQLLFWHRFCPGVGAILVSSSEIVDSWNLAGFNFWSLPQANKGHNIAQPFLSILRNSMELEVERLWAKKLQAFPHFQE